MVPPIAGTLMPLVVAGGAQEATEAGFCAARVRLPASAACSARSCS
jgi:hypothetical protein